MSTRDPVNKPVGICFTVFVYPFFHRFEKISDFAKQISLFDRWLPWISRLPDENAAVRAFDDTFIFLPFARDLLFPEFAGIHYSTEGIELVKQLYSSSKQTLPRILAPNNRSPLQARFLLRLTLREHELNPIRTFTIRHPIDKYSLNSQIEWIDLFLCAQQIGFLAIKTKPSNENLLLADLFDFNYYFRSIIPPTLNWEMAELHVAGKNEINSTQKLVEFLLDGLVEPNTKDYLASTVGQVYGERFNTYSYAVIDMKNDIEIFQKADPPFQTVADRILYEYATTTPWGSSVEPNGTYVPSRESVTNLFENFGLSFWQTWRGMSLRDTVVFLAHVSNDFTVKHLLHNVENDYFNLYLFSLFQKTGLYRFMHEVIQENDNPRKTLRSTRRVLNRFVQFRNRFWALEICRKPQGEQIFHKYQFGLGTRELFQRVDDEIKNLSAFHEAKLSRKIKNLLDIITFIITPILLVSGIFHAEMFTLDSHWISPNWVLLFLSLLGVGLLYAIIFIVYYIWERHASK